MPIRPSQLRALSVFALVAWACVALAQDGSRSRSKRRRDTAAAKAGVEMLTPTLTPEQASARARAHVQVVMYSAAWCGVCNDARAFFSQQGIAFVEHDVERDSAARARHRALSPSGSLPTIQVDDQVMQGFSAKSFQKVFDKAVQARIEHGDPSGPKTFEVHWDRASR
jgi:glutaredoxin